MKSIVKKREQLKTNTTTFKAKTLIKLIKTEYSRLERQILLTFTLFLVLALSNIPIVAAQDEDLDDICGSIDEAGLSNILESVTSLFMGGLLLYGIAIYGWSKFQGGTSGVEKPKWAVGTIVAIYVGYLAALHVVGIDFGCVLPLV